MKARASAETINYASFSDNGDGTIAVYNGNGDTFIESAMSLINVHNMLINETGTLSLEKLIEVNPDVMIISKYAGGIDPQETINKLLANKQVQSINAVKTRRSMLLISTISGVTEIPSSQVLRSLLMIWGCNIT